MQSNLATTYQALRRREPALRLRKAAYTGYLKVLGEEHVKTLLEANNYAAALKILRRFEEAKSLLRKVIPVARRVLGDTQEYALRMRSVYANALYEDPVATLDDVREAVTTLEDTARIARRVLGGANPLTGGIEKFLGEARAALRARETQPPRTFARGWLDGPG